MKILNKSNFTITLNSITNKPIIFRPGDCVEFTDIEDFNFYKNLALNFGNCFEFDYKNNDKVENKVESKEVKVSDEVKKRGRKVKEETNIEKVE